MHEEATSEIRIAGAILGRLFPPLDLAADDLYTRVNAGERVDDIYVPSSLGFETGLVDHVLIEAFKACAPAVKAFLTAGGMALIAAWINHRTAADQRQRELESLRREQAVCDSLERLVDLMLRHSAINDRRLAEEKIARIITQVPERTSGIEKDPA
jgi:hypothetical protein